MQVIQYRRALHRIPELDRDLPETLSYLRGFSPPLLHPLLSHPRRSVRLFSTLAGPTPSPSAATPTPCPSPSGPGCPLPLSIQGACTPAATTATWPWSWTWRYGWTSRPPCPTTSCSCFSRRRETTGGAKDLCQSGVLEAHKVQCVFGMHLWPELPAGVIASRKREMMSRSCEVSVTITGRSSHIAKAEEGLDALAAGVEFYRRAAALEAALPPHLFRLLKFGRMESGTVRNAVSGKTVLLGSLRAFQDEVFLDLQQGLREIGQQVQADTGCQVAVHTNDGYPAVWNPDALYDRVKNLGLPFLELEKPVMISEDFSWYQRHLPALFFFFGLRPPRPFTRTTLPLTSPF